MNASLLVAGLLSAGITLIHLFLGGREIAQPLLASEGLRGVPKYTLYYCWHLVSLTLAGMALAFVLAAWPGGSRAMAQFATVGAGLFALLCFAINARFSRPLARHPQGLLFLPVAALGAYGLWA